MLGEDLYKSNSNIKNSIGYMAQKFSLYGNLKIKDNLDFFSGIYGLKNKKREEKIEEMIEIFDFKNYLHLNANSLPLGIKQRLSLACSVMHEPKVLFLDEPTSGVDPITRKEFWTHINGMVKKGVSIMVTTHFMDEAEYCDKIMLIYKGKNIASGTPDELKALVAPNASMQDAFITLVKKYDKEEERLVSKIMGENVYTVDFVDEVIYTQKMVLDDDTASLNIKSKEAFISMGAKNLGVEEILGYKCDVWL